VLLTCAAATPARQSEKITAAIRMEKNEAVLAEWRNILNPPFVFEARTKVVKDAISLAGIAGQENNMWLAEAGQTLLQQHPSVFLLSTSFSL